MGGFHGLCLRGCGWGYYSIDGGICQGGG
jgi:hypothetical protein